MMLKSALIKDFTAQSILPRRYVYASVNDRAASKNPMNEETRKLIPPAGTSA
jgi:hypothetical protein